VAVGCWNETAPGTWPCILAKKEGIEVQRRSWKSLPIVIAALLAFASALVAPAGARAGGDEQLSRQQRRVLEQYAADTWQSFVAMVDPNTGLPSDNVSATRVRAAYTSPTNIGTYIWSTLAARDLQIIKPKEARDRIGKVLDTLAGLERHAGSGQFYNWYNPATGAKLTVWPVDGGTVYPFLSSVDNGWLAAALIMVKNAVPQLRGKAGAILNTMDFSCYYDPNARGPDFGAGLLRGGFWDTSPPPGSWPTGNYCGKGPDVYYTGHHYGTLNTEPRIASYIAITRNGVPPEHYFAMWRTFPPTCDWGWPETNPTGAWRSYLGLDVYEGHYTYRDLQIVPTWGGSMFEALMVPLLVPEEQWGRQSWGVNHPLYVRAQIEHGLEEADYGYWGFSPSNNPDGGYREYGVDPLGMDTNGYTSDQERTTVDYGFRDPSGTGYCPGREPQPLPAGYGRGVVTPHASFLALRYAPAAALKNLASLKRDFDAYSWGGFYDAIEVKTGTVSKYYLALDQGMVMAAIGNALRNDRLRDYFSKGAIEDTIRPLLRMEEFTAGE
jgi:hypothetical protein